VEARKSTWIISSIIVMVIMMADLAWAAGPFALVVGRRDPRVAVIDLDKALDPANDGTPNAVISRVRVTNDVDTDGDGIPDAPASGLPSNIVIPENGRAGFVVNHAGNATPAAVNAFQHGHLGTVTVLDLRKALDPANNNTTNAIDAVISTQLVPGGPSGFGPVGLALTQDGKFALVNNSESNGKEDGARDMSIIDLEQGAVVQSIQLALADGGKIAQDPGKSCAELDADPTLLAMSLPNKNFGCFSASNGLGISLRRGGFAFTANGGTDDVSVIDVDRALAGDPNAEVARIPVERGPWGLAVSPGGGLVAVTNRESPEGDLSTVGYGTIVGTEEGNLISILDVERAIAGATSAEVARVQVGIDNPTNASRPFSLAFTPNGRKLVVTNFRSNNVSVVDVREAIEAGLTGGTSAEVARIPLVKPGGGPARPRGVAVTPNGKFAVVAGGAAAGGLPLGGNGAFCEQVVADINSCGALWIIDLRSHTVVATVTGVGNEPYLVDITHGGR
jgi:DNA-binding beta-propeller fold protein YncE